jgi:hypothetical protein
MSDPDKLKLVSVSVTDEQRVKLKLLFPEVFTGGGKIDFERLKLALGEMVDSGKERYGMNWPGKVDCFKTIQRPSLATLVPAKEELVAWDTTENLIIEGGNIGELNSKVRTIKRGALMCPRHRRRWRSSLKMKSKKCGSYRAAKGL